MDTAENVEHVPSTNQYALFLIYVNIALYATCYQIQRPLEPFLVEVYNIMICKIPVHKLFYTPLTPLTP